MQWDGSIRSQRRIAGCRVVRKDKSGSFILGEVNLRHTSIGGHERMLVTARNINERKKADQRRAAMARISEAARSTQDLSDFYQLIHAIIRTLLPAKNFYIALYDSARDILSYPYFSDEYDLPPAPHRLDKGLTAYV